MYPPNWLLETLRWLGENWSEIGNLLFTAAVAWTAIVGFRLSRRLADAELDPAVVVLIEANREEFSFFDLVIRNLGKGAARDVRFRIEPDIPVETDDPESRLTAIAAIGDGLNYLAPSQEIRTFYGSIATLTEQVITVHVTYRRDTGRSSNARIAASFPLDVKQYRGLSRVGKPVEVVVSQALDQIADDVRTVARGGILSNVKVTVTRRYVFSRVVTQFWRRWVGGQYMTRDYTPWRHFHRELRRTVSNWRRRRFGR